VFALFPGFAATIQMFSVTGIFSECPLFSSLKCNRGSLLSSFFDKSEKIYIVKIDKDIALPLYAKISLVLIGFYVFFSMLYLTKDIVVPFVFALLIATLLYPVVRFFMHYKVNRVIGILIAMSITFLIFSAIGYLLISQASRFSDSWPEIKDKFTQVLNGFITSAAGYFDISPQKVQDWLLQTKNEFTDKLSGIVGQSIIIVGSGLVTLLLLPIYVFLILYYEPLLKAFILRLFEKKNHIKVKGVISKVKKLIQSYLMGLVIETIIIAILEIIALLVLGIDYAILLGVIGALLNIIPYIGGLVAVAIPMVIALVTKSTEWYALYVLIAYYFIQLVDNNYIVPVIVASKVKINALISILAFLAGNALWGVPGMFLSLPLIAIAKLIFDHVETLKPWGLLLGDTIPGNGKVKNNQNIKQNDANKDEITEMI